MADYNLQYQDTYIDALLATANELKTAGFIYKGVATPLTNPGTPTERVAYLASEPGTYTNFGGTVITSGLYALLYDGSAWSGVQMQIRSDIIVDQSVRADLDFADENGFVILRLKGGHIKTKYFDSSHWYGKKWYAYGTSLTNTNNEGKYATFVEQYSGMIRTNKGISGGALVANRNIYNAIMNVTDGKTEADLITLECLANDASSPFGTVQDTDNTTFLGSLGLCIAYLQQNTAAQIVIISSMRGRKNVAGTEQFYPYSDEEYTDKCEAMEKLCLMYGVYYINPNHAMGYYRKTDAYYVDNIHHTSLGGKVFADYIWSKLKDVPLWSTQL